MLDSSMILRSAVWRQPPPAAARLLAIVMVVLLVPSAAWASPSAFPETAVSFRVGYQSGFVGEVSGELLVPVPFIDLSTALEAQLGSGGTFGVRLVASGLIFPALGTTPPLALGLGADLGVRRGSSLVATTVTGHLGVVAGTDLLFVFDLPAVVSAYLAPGFSTTSGFSLAWALQFRYYFDRIALEASISDWHLFAVGLRILF